MDSHGLLYNLTLNHIISMAWDVEMKNASLEDLLQAYSSLIIGLIGQTSGCTLWELQKIVSFR
ncbi:MAG: hypothetical protein COZ32_13160 [Nitrospirae bacterium CG_4_10_14_3_um_filter_53_41]|nr:MAG: hypothetical protein COZ32_13160 [Nitrospirae bacterium CG_4_10_14_3_um_filter_53_41]